MAAELSEGSVPNFYRDVYNLICPDGSQKIDHDMFIKFLFKSTLTKPTLSQIWELSSSGLGYLNRTGFYKALALTSFVQQGKQVNENTLSSFSGQEFPKPSLGDLSDLKLLSVKLRNVKNPSKLGFSYDEICDIDTIKIEAVPEKKGLFLKHFEYEVSSSRLKSTVKRRYNDFVTLFEALILRYPYRAIPRLPPKKVNTDAQFREERRRSLRRFLTLVCRHPVISEDRIISFFLTYSGSDCQTKIKEQFKGVPDEFLTNEHAINARDYVPIDTSNEFSTSKEKMKAIYTCISQMRGVLGRFASRSQDAAADMLIFSKELNNLTSKPYPDSSWGTGDSNTYETLKTSFRNLGPYMNKLSESHFQQSALQEDEVVEEFDLFLDLLLAYKDLCDRHDRGVLNDHQRAVSKMINMSKRKSSNKYDLNVDVNLESRILEQEQELANMENRNYFSLHCIHIETQLVHVYMDTLATAFRNLTLVQRGSHQDLLKSWEEILPFTEVMKSNMKSSACSVPSSPIHAFNASPLSSPASPSMTNNPPSFPTR